MRHAISSVAGGVTGLASPAQDLVPLAIRCQERGAWIAGAVAGRERRGRGHRHRDLGGRTVEQTELCEVGGARCSKRVDAGGVVGAVNNELATRVDYTAAGAAVPVEVL